MMAVTAARTAGTFFVVCDICLWTPGRALPEYDAFAAADGHTPKCPGSIPAAATKAQITKAQKILNGDY